MSEYVSQKARGQRARHRRNVAAGLCKCGRPRKPRKRRCERCLADASRWSYKKRYGERPVAVCARCLLGARARRAWAMPDSPFCARHQLTAGDADRAAVRQADRIRAAVRRAMAKATSLASGVRWSQNAAQLIRAKGATG